MAAKTGTYTLIGSQVVGGLSGIIDFNSIPQTYTDLVLVSSILANASTSANVQFNFDSGSNYSYTVLDANGSTVSSNRQTNVSGIQLAAWSSNLGSSTSPSPAIMHINDYSNATTFKTAVVRSAAYGSSAACVDAFVGLWRNTAAINSIRVNANSFAAGSTFRLYGIEAGNL